ncbi:MAG: glycosyltransferase family 1 protein, partial [Negativicutes bacterium]|nr:glycosyltransferase family 1 protein [Negativicutes bacterium]
MILGIDASNIRSGGGLTHLKELLSHATPQDYGFSKVIVWSCRATLEQLPDVSWLEKKHVSFLDRNLIIRILWHYFIMPKVVNVNCDLLFVPGGNFHGSKVPFVAMSQNLLPFDDVERKRFRFTWTGIRLFLLKYGQLISFNKA